ncbi:MAG: SH3 domain-containing protein [Chloroflexi bacterium]|nr:SH3 domain-containing protein [Chloroflexota bacterium]
MNLQVLAITPGFAPAFRVLGADDDSVLFEVANADAQNIARGIVNLPAATYIVEVRSANNTPGQYLISPQPNAPLPTATPISTTVPMSTLTPEPDGTCSVTPNSSQDVNVRFGPGTNYGIIGSLAEGTSALVIGRLTDHSWFQIDRGRSVGWVSATVVMLTGACGSVSVVVPPGLPPTQLPIPTLPPNPTQIAEPGSPTATTPPNVPPSSTPTPTSRFTIPGAALTNVFTSDLPDLRVTSLHVEELTFEDTPDVVIRAYISELNYNPEHSTNVTVSVCIHVPGEYCQTYTVVLTNGSNVPGFRVPPEYRGVYQVTVTVDADNRINESNEGNNSASSVLDLQPPDVFQ